MESIDSKVTILLSKCVVSNSKKSRFIKEQEAIGLLSKKDPFK